MKTLEANGSRFAVVDRGDGPPVVLVHGFPLDHTMWDVQIEALTPRYRVIAPDLRGFGRSQATGGVATMGKLADDLAALLDGLRVRQPVFFCGLSMGGYVAFQFWRRHGARLRALVLCDTRAENDTREMAVGRLAMADRVLREGPSPLVETMMPKLFAESTVRQRPQVVESLRRVMLATPPEGIAAAARGMAERPNMTASLPEIDCPTLVVVGQQDAISTAAEMRGMAEAIPGSRFVELAGSGHMSPMEKPAEFNVALLDFLAAL